MLHPMHTLIAIYSIVATAFFAYILYPVIDRNNFIYTVPLVFLFLFFISMPLWLDWSSDSSEH